jgi:hypothetical protein
MDGKNTNPDIKPETLRGLLLMALRFPLAAVSPQHQNHIFTKLVLLDKTILKGKISVSLSEDEKLTLLVLTRRGIARLLHTVSKSTIEVGRSLSQSNLQDSALVDAFVSLFKRLDSYPSDELRTITLRCFEILLRYF